MYVQYVKLAQPKARFPILLWHGGGLTGVTWETKPDGKPGWQQFFLNAGYDVYVSDAVERGRASWARYREIFKSEPMFRTKKEAWELLRIGLAQFLPPKAVALEPINVPMDGGTAAVLNEDGLKITAIRVHHDPVKPAHGYQGG